MVLKKHQNPTGGLNAAGRPTRKALALRKWKCGRKS